MPFGGRRVSCFCCDRHYIGNFNNLTKYYDFMFVNFLNFRTAKAVYNIEMHFLKHLSIFSGKKILLIFIDLYSFLTTGRGEKSTFTDSCRRLVFNLRQGSRQGFL